MQLLTCCMDSIVAIVSVSKQHLAISKPSKISHILGTVPGTVDYMLHAQQILMSPGAVDYTLHVQQILSKNTNYDPNIYEVVSAP